MESDLFLEWTDYNEIDNNCLKWLKRRLGGSVPPSPYRVKFWRQVWELKRVLVIVGAVISENVVFVGCGAAHQDGNFCVGLKFHRALVQWNSGWAWKISDPACEWFLKLGCLIMMMMILATISPLDMSVKMGVSRSVSSPLHVRKSTLISPVMITDKTWFHRWDKSRST